MVTVVKTKSAINTLDNVQNLFYNKLMLLTQIIYFLSKE